MKIVTHISKWLAIYLSTYTAAGCKRPNPALDEAQTVSSCRNSTSGKNSSEKLSFYGDILPILAANTPGYAFKCTTCHAEYNDPKRVINVPELTRIIDSMKSRRMPRSGDAVPNHFIDLFTQWRLEGFAVGSPGDPVSIPGKRAGVDKIHSDCGPQ